MIEVWQDDFEDRLRIRFYTHHSKCSQCLRHRLIIKKLGHCAPARRAQHELLQRHLSRQYKDRQCYWASRARSRLSATTLGECEVTCILGSMDAQKHSWPRSRAMSSKEFASFCRPRLTSTSLIIHGFSVTVALSPNICSANSSRSTEILAHGFSQLSTRLDLRKVRICIQADNYTKEIKNNGTLRLIGMWTALRKIAGGELSFLSSGHSHEDIDAMFNLLRSCIESHRELWTPESFRSCIESFFEDPKNRPFEPHRKVLLMSKFRDWTLDYNLDRMIFHLDLFCFELLYVTQL